MRYPYRIYDQHNEVIGKGILYKINARTLADAARRQAGFTVRQGVASWVQLEKNIWALVDKLTKKRYVLLVVDDALYTPAETRAELLEGE